ncbi:MAG: ATP-binding protein [Bacteroidota bacterium]
MSELKHYSIAFDLLGNILIFNKHDELVYAGNEIGKQLRKSGVFNTEDEFKDTDSWIHISTILAEVRENREPRFYKFKKVNHEFFIFPSTFKTDGSLILVSKRKFSRISKIERDLNERVKELECLYNISRELAINENLAIALENCTAHIIKGLQFPEITSVEIYLDNIHVSAGPIDMPVRKMIREDIVRNSKKRGDIEVRYHKVHNFLEEEEKMVSEIAGKISRALEKEERARALLKREKVLKSKNETLLKLTRECSQSREKLRTFFSAITDTIIVIDTGYNIIMSNKADIGDSGKCYKKLFNLQEQCNHCPSTATFKHGDNSSEEIQFENKCFKLESYPIYDNKKNVSGVLELCRDITKEKRLEFHLMQNYKLASLGKLVAGVAHEINNPNTFILGNLKILKDAFQDIIPVLDGYYEDNPEMKIARLNYTVFRENIAVLLDDMHNGAIRMKRIVEGLRNFAKNDEGLQPENVNINKIINDNLRVVKNQVRRSARVEMELNPNVPTFKGSINKIEQVLLNMIINASQAIEHADGFILISTDFNKDNKNIIIKIADNGKGMDEKTRRSIFDPFFTTKRDKGGTGLGLSISYGIIKELKGTIDVDSVVGKGTTFTIRIPMVQNELQ